jgi:ankyrin repeat protein
VGHDCALRVAVNRHKFDLIPLLVEHGADVNVNDGMPLRTAVCENEIELAEFLVAHGADVNVVKLLPGNRQQTPLGLAVEKNNLPMAKMLAEHGAFISDTLVAHTLSYEYFPVADAFLAVRAQQNCPVDLNALVCRMHSCASIRWCVEHGVHDRAVLQNGLYLAAACLNTEYAQWFIDQGADINADNGKILLKVISYAYYKEERDWPYNDYVLYMRLHALDVIRWLFDHGLAPVFKDAALCYASKAGYREIVDELIRLGADVNAQDGCLACHAIKKRSLDELMRLVEYGADVCDDKFMTLAEQVDDKRILQFLRIMRKKQAQHAPKE